MPAPAFVQRLLSSFPIYEYPEQVVGTSTSTSSGYSSAPSEPTLWLHGPGITSEKESFDVECLKVQSAAAFSGIKTATKWLETSEGVPGSNLPALHLPNGDLLPSASINGWIAKQKASASDKQDDKGGYNVEKEDGEDAKLKSENTRIQARTYSHLMDTKLQPALLAHLFLNSNVYTNLTVPLYFPQTIEHGTADHPARPVLTRYAYSALSKSRKLEMQGELAEKLVPGSGPSASSSWFSKGKGKLDLEDIQRQGEEALQLLEDKIDNEGRGWFFGTLEASDVDAALYANLHIIYILHAPHLDAANPLRRKLEKCPQLFRWVKRLHKDYF